jgi:cytoskeletal protein RodZ
MNKSTFFFLVLILAAAIVTGSTLGVISNIELIKSAAQNQNQSAMNADTEKSTAGQSQPEQNKTLQTASTSAENTSTQVMVVSPEEGAEITSMLVKLGMPNDGDSGTFVKQYQASHGIQPTGNIDSITLNSIINDVRMKRVTEMTQ